MAAPNLVSVSSIYGKTKGAALGTSSADILTCASDKVYKVNSIIVSNIDGSNAADTTVIYNDSSASANFHLAKTVTVPAKSTLVVMGKDSPIYLEEGDKIAGLASAASDLEIIISWEELDDA
tara:strand:+ start:2095 stop:2460 length:366 start_codon:yes stop_codon:yes gene_type:complete